MPGKGSLPPLPVLPSFLSPLLASPLRWYLPVWLVTPWGPGERRADLASADASCPGSEHPRLPGCCLACGVSGCWSLTAVGTAVGLTLSHQPGLTSALASIVGLPELPLCCPSGLGRPPRDGVGLWVISPLAVVLSSRAPRHLTPR